ncbi:MAG TPA: HlyD family efflux transporter periplasmic adaptor subunit [Clostridia bacterium]|nr:HlyD family efflux transporter periplasmic adaptor subunit [Clostridia bacterium]
MRKSNKKHQALEYGVLLVIIIFFLYNMLALLGDFKEADAPYIVEYGSIVQENEYDCLIIRDEILVFPVESGKVKYKVNEGDKVRKGYPLYDIEAGAYGKDGGDDAYHVDIKTSVEYLRVAYENLDVGKQVDDIRKLSAYGIYDRISLIKNAIDEKIMQTDGEEIETETVNRYNGSNSPISGIVSFNIDGYEEILSRESVMLLNMEKIRSETINSANLKGKEAETDEPIMKIVDNSAWYVYVYTDLRNIGRFNEGSSVKIVFEEENVDAMVVETNNEIGNCYAILRISEQAKTFLGKRATRMHIINKNINGLIVPVDALVYQEDEIGVLIKNINGKAVFKPVGVKGSNNEWAVVSDGIFYRKDENGNAEAVDTVKVYDEIIVDISD